MNTLVKVISTVVQQGKRLVKVLYSGNDDIRQMRDAGPYGIDSNPLKDMIAVYAHTSERGKDAIIGYVNKNALAAVGELRMFSTSEDGAASFYAWLKNDGTAEIGGNVDFLVRYSALETGYNELRDDFNALVLKHNQFLTEYKTHVHTGVTTGAGSSGTTVSTQTNADQSTADISGAKIEEIKTL